MWIQIPAVGLRSYSSVKPLATMEDSKNIKDDKKEKESPELKEELTEDQLDGVDGGVSTPTHPIAQAIVD